MWKVLAFGSARDLEVYLRTTGQAPAVPQDATKVAAIYYDGASGKHILILAP